MITETNENNPSKPSKVPENLGLNGFAGEESGKPSDFLIIISQIPKDVREKLTVGYDMKKFAKVFENYEMMRTLEGFLKCGMNVSLASRELYMHRNTLIYRLAAVKKTTGLDLRLFEDAVTFKFLHYLYLLK